MVISEWMARLGDGLVNERDRVGFCEYKMFVLMIMECVPSLMSIVVVCVCVVMW